MINFPSKLVDVLSRISARGYEAYFVGGCVRDAILGVETFDIDINTNAPTEILTELFSDYSPMIYENYGNLTFKLDEFTIDITRFRKESKYVKHRYPKSISFSATLKDDIMRRDFTINALVYHPEKGIGDLVDGLDSLKNREMKTIGNPYLKLNEDYLRMLRLVRISSKLNFSIEPHTFRVLKEHYYRVSELGLSQIENDFLGFLKSPYFVETALRNPFFLTDIIPEMKETVGFNQNNIFHNYDLFEHTIRVIGSLDTLELKVAALFHDLGKIQSQVTNPDGTMSFPNHATHSLKIMNAYFTEWTLTGCNKETVRKLVLLHDLSIPMDYVEMKKLVNFNGIDFMRKLIKFKRADNLAKNKNAYYQVEKCNNYDMFLNKIEQDKPPLTIADLAISGQELQVDHNIRHRILSELIGLVIEDKIPNTKESLLTEAIRIRDGIH